MLTEQFLLLDDARHVPLRGLMRCFRHIAFRAFSFLIAESFLHTRKRMNYFLQQLGFAVVGEVHWYLMNGADGTHNVLFAQTLGAMALAAFVTF